MKKLSSNEIRNLWLNYFENKGHKVEPSSSLVPVNDDSLLWNNAGIVPLKKYFDGSVIPKNKKITNSQKCIRTNDIDNVGVTSRHHTFFEMLGNFSIGDYFREDAIKMCFELFTDKKYFDFEISKLYFTVYPTDEESYNLWLSLGVKETNIIKTNYNFWEIGEGPCGPCTEIFYDRGLKYDDRGPEMLENDIENDRYIELYNIVFSQFNSSPNKSREEYKELPSKNIDTGAGLERLACIIQDVDSNYETDLFMPIINKIMEISNVDYKSQKEFKIIADHIKTVVFAISDGVQFSNEGRGYVLRRLLRRAVKNAIQLGIEKPFLNDLVEVVIDLMKDYYPKINKNKDIVNKLILSEEIKFLKTIKKGEEKIKLLLEKNNQISKEEAFLLYDTFGFPIELTIEYAKEKNKEVDFDGFISLLNEQKERARKARKTNNSMTTQNEEYLNFKSESKFNYKSLSLESKVIKVFEEGIVLDETVFYAVSGGQVSDVGTINNIEVKDVIKLPNKQHLHIGDFNVSEGDLVSIKVDERLRNQVTANHTVTHILYNSLRKILGQHVSQQGSNTGFNVLRFDFNHYESLDEETILKIELEVKEFIKSNYPVNVLELSLEDAKAIGATAEFGEKYSENVRVVNISDKVIDLCGGTHVSNTSEINDFSILSISSIGSGIYRLEAATSNLNQVMEEYLKNTNNEIDSLINKSNELISNAKTDNIKLEFSFKKNTEFTNSYKSIINKRNELINLKDIIKKLDKEYKKSKTSNVKIDVNQFEKDIVDKKLVIKLVNIDKQTLKVTVDQIMDLLKLEFLFVANVVNESVVFVAKSNNGLDCGKLVKEAAIICKGNGGGRKNFAQAGGKDVSFVEEALETIKSKI